MKHRDSAGYAITGAALGGDISDIAWNGLAHSYAIVIEGSFNTLLVSWSAVSGQTLGTVYAPGGYSLTDCELNDRGELYVCNSNLLAPGLHVEHEDAVTRHQGDVPIRGWIAQCRAEIRGQHLDSPDHIVRRGW